MVSYLLLKPGPAMIEANARPFGRLVLLRRVKRINGRTQSVKLGSVAVASKYHKYIELW